MSEIIKIKNLSFCYENGKFVLQNLNAAFPEGKLIALIGKNGSGKSTLLECISGMNEFSGVVELDGRSIDDYSINEFSKKLAYIPQQTQINLDFTVREFISFGRNPHVSLFGKLTDDDYLQIENNAKVCGIEKLLENDINKISGGERQLAYIARALTQDASVILMDEPAAFLDFGNQQKLFFILRQLIEKGKTIIFTTHNPNHLINLDCVIFSLIDGRLENLKSLTLDVVKEIYNETAIIEGQGFLFN